MIRRWSFNGKFKLSAREGILQPDLSMSNMRGTRCPMASAQSKFTSRSLSIRCRGEPINREALFEYTNGRFLVNEKRETARRYAKFDVEALCRVVSSIPDVSSPICKIDKMEGGFNKALLLTAENQKQVIAKIPCPSVVAPGYSTASEVALLDYVRSRSSVPVPKVLAWSSVVSNSVASEYLVLEAAPGRQLVEIWGDMSELDKFKLIKNLAKLESQLAAIEFPAYGNLYSHSWLSAQTARSDEAVEVDSQYCIGPPYSSTWPSVASSGTEPSNDYAGPWRGLSDLGLALAKRGLWNVKHSRMIPARPPHYGSIAEHVHLLEIAMNMIPALAASPHLQRHSKPAIWHTDLHLGNIFVSEHDSTEIVNLIDWQFTGIMPRFTQVRWPLFLEPPENYRTGTVKPELPPDFDTMDSDEKALAVANKDQAMLSKCYEAALVKSHKGSYLALTQVDEAIRGLFTCCETTYKDGIIPLRDYLIKLSENWDHFDFPADCPYKFNREEISRHDLESSRYRDWQKLREYTQLLLQSDDDGWVAPQLDFDKVKAKHDELLELYLKSEATNMTRDQAMKLWFYLEGG